MKRVFFITALVLGLVSPALADWKQGFEIRLDGGLVSPVSGSLYQNYNSSSSFGGALGYQLGWLSFLVDAQYDSLNPSLQGSTASFNTLELALVEKAHWGAGTSIKPFVFLGEGLAMSSITGSSGSESDPLLEAGLGLDFFAANNFTVFIQSKGSFLLSSSQTVAPDKLTVLLPIQMGVDFIP